MKCALVTGGSRGIGRAICIQLAKEGYYVLINFKNNKEEANKTLSLIKEQNGNGELLQFDVSKKEDIKTELGKWIDDNSEKFIEVLVNNAGIKDDALMSWMSDEQWDNIIKTNLDSFFYVTRIVLTQMLTKKYGRIINVVSLSGLKGMAGQTNYAA
ncbi:MAG: SDR family NAD(P)-dependent oxidoreductase, partial [Parafilimonas sp.]